MRKVLFIAAVTLLLQLAPGASPTTDRIPSPFGFMDREWIPAG
jgi:hypothetical protein